MTQFRMVPSRFSPWSMSGLPRDAANPLDFNEVWLWKIGEGSPTRIKTDDLPRDFDEAKHYWKPIEDGDPPPQSIKLPGEAP